MIFELAPEVDNYEGPFDTEAWPLFHASEADPDGGYRTYPRPVEFELDGDAASYVLEVDYVVSMPRMARLELDVNGVRGNAYLRPRPSESGELGFRAALHTTLYGEGRLRVALPGTLLRRGANTLTLTARDDGEVLRVANPEAVKRLDRMASAAGLVYRRIALAEGAAELHVDVHASPVYRQGRELCELDVALPGPFDGAEVDVAGVPLTLPAAAFGHLRVPFELPDGEGDVDWEVLGVRGTLRRRRKWTVHVTPHAHTDIGYTHRQSEIGERHARNIDEALALEASYHVDSAWTLEPWLATRTPERHAELAQQIREGRFGVSGLYVDALTQHAALEDLVRNASVAARLLDELGAETDFAAVVDVPSLTSSLPAVLAGSGLRYLVHAGNQDRGPLRLNGALHRSSPFLWEGAGGARVLVWMAKMYCELRKVCGSPPVPDSARPGLDLWLQEYERDDYPLDTVLLYGQEADNTDLDPQPLAFVERWNETYEWPRLVFSDVSAFFRAVEPHAERLPVVRGDGGAYWEDGCGSAAATTALARRAQAELPAAERLATLAALHHPDGVVAAERFDEAWRALLLWDEHTWGAFLSTREPDALLQRDQWAVKERFARDAAGLGRDLLHGAATRHALELATEGREVVVHNPHSWPVSGPAVVEIELGETLDAPLRQLHAGTSQQTIEVWVDEVPGLSYRRFPLRRGLAAAAARSLENERYRLEIDRGRGCLTSLYDRVLGRELVDPDAPFGFGQLVHVLGGDGTRLVSNQADLPAAELEITTPPVEVEWLLRDTCVEVSYRWRKEERAAKEAAYIAFPADLPDAEVWSDSQLGWVRWGVDELPGACQEWLPLQTSILVRGDGCDLLVCSPDVPLFCVGDVVRGRWPVRKPQRGGRLYSYVLNNYWHTNYRGAQGGELEFRYGLTSAAAIEPADAFRRGWEARRPLYAQRISLQDFRAPVPPYDGRDGGTLAVVEPEHVVLSTLKAADDGRGFVARFQEIAGRPARARLTLPGVAVAEAWLTDLVERDVTQLDGLEVDVPAWGLATVRFVPA